MTYKAQLKITSISYLLLPSILFLLTWVKPLWGFSSTLVILLMSFQVFKTIIQTEPTHERSQRPSNFNIGILFIISLLFNVLLGIGEFREQTSDFIANNFKIYDLVKNDFPVFYSDYKVYLCYYLGYYLPTAMLGKVFGLAFCHYFLLLWSTLGVFLTLSWVYTFSRKAPFLLIIAFLLYSHSWIFIHLLRFLEIDTIHFQAYFIKIKDFMLAINSFVNNYAWAPQHTIPACLGICLIINNYLHKESLLIESVLVLMSTIFWSPFATIGLFPFVLVLFLKNIKILFHKSHFSELLQTAFLCVGFLPILSYLTSTQGVNADNTGVIWNAGEADWWVYYLFYFIIHFGIWAILAFSYKSKFQELFMIAFGTLCLLAFCKIGMMNDLNIRASVPSLVILSITIGYIAIHYFSFKKPQHWAWMLFFFINSAIPILKILKGFLPSKPETTIENHFNTGSFTMLQHQEKTYNKSAVKEYSLAEGSTFEKYFLKH